MQDFMLPIVLLLLIGVACMFAAGKAVAEAHYWKRRLGEEWGREFYMFAVGYVFLAGNTFYSAWVLSQVK